MINEGASVPVTKTLVWHVKPITPDSFHPPQPLPRLSLCFDAALSWILTFKPSQRYEVCCCCCCYSLPNFTPYQSKCRSAPTPSSQPTNQAALNFTSLCGKLTVLLPRTVCVCACVLRQMVVFALFWIHICIQSVPCHAVVHEVNYLRKWFWS